MDRAFRPQLFQILNCLMPEHAEGGSPLQVRVARANFLFPLSAKEIHQRFIAANARPATARGCAKPRGLCGAVNFAENACADWHVAWDNNTVMVGCGLFVV
jgi:hypothetical protein